MTAPEFFLGPADEVAPRLLGWRLQSTLGNAVTEIELSEVEAYTQDDPASHSFAGIRPHNVAMFEAPGILYIYRSYGVHWCANVVCSPDGLGAGILLRAGRPVQGVEVMTRRRGRGERLTIGPGNLTQALGISGEHNGLDLFDPASPVRLLPGRQPHRYLATPRIGISKATDKKWRFVSVQGF